MKRGILVTVWEVAATRRILYNGLLLDVITGPFEAFLMAHGECLFHLSGRCFPRECDECLWMPRLPQYLVLFVRHSLRKRKDEESCNTEDYKLEIKIRPIPKSLIASNKSEFSKWKSLNLYNTFYFDKNFKPKCTCPESNVEWNKLEGT